MSSQFRRTQHHRAGEEEGMEGLVVQVRNTQGVGIWIVEGCTVFSGLPDTPK